MKDRRIAAALALAGALTLPAHATDIAIVGDGSWNPFSVDSFLAPVASSLSWIDDAGTPLDFIFTIAAGRIGTLTVVDADFAGDTFSVFNFASLLGATSSVPRGSFEASHDVGLDYAAALADPAFSRGTFTLAPGSYKIGGSLLQSVTFAGADLDATAGALRLTTVAAAVPEPEAGALLMAGFIAMGALLRRRQLGR